MSEDPGSDEQLIHPDRVVGPDGSRGDGRPTRTNDDPGGEAGPEGMDLPTVAPEEGGETPSTEHAPGADL